MLYIFDTNFIDDISLGTQSFAIDVPNGFVVQTILCHSSFSGVSGLAYRDSFAQSGNFIVPSCPSSYSGVNEIIETGGGIYLTQAIAPMYIDLVAPGSSMANIEVQVFVEGYNPVVSSYSEIAIISGSSTSNEVQVDFTQINFAAAFLVALISMFIVIYFFSFMKKK